jgi:hypothetical protein
MFKVENADFIAEKLAAELLPNQEYREGYKNAEEAVERRLRADRAARQEPTPGRIEFDVDWALHAQDNSLWYLSVADNGDGMTRAEIEKYTTTLAVTGANQNQSITGNQGMGLKISGPTRHKEGILLRSLKDGQRTMVQVGWTGLEYDLVPLNDNGDVVVDVPEELFPDFILEQGSGTIVTYLGNTPKENTVVPGQTRVWLFKYLHQRFFRLGNGDFSLMVRQPAREVSEWPHSREEADAAQYFNRAEVIGTGGQWDKYADRQGDGRRGVQDLPGLPSAGIPVARMHWWVLPAPGPGNDLTSRTYGGGSLGVLYQNELHDWRTGGPANPYFARLGIIFGKQRIAFVLEPVGDGISSDFARAHVLIGGRPVFEGETWAWWADSFRERMPDMIRQTIVEEQQRLHEEDPERAKRIRDRLKEVVAMLRPRRARRNPEGPTTAGGEDVAGTGSDDQGGSSYERSTGGGTASRRSNGNRQQGVGSLLPQVDVENGEPANEVFSLLKLNPRWVTEAEAEGMTIVNANGKGLRDRAAALAGVDGLSASELLLNLEFRGYKMILQHVNEWGNPDGDSAVATAIEQFTQEWIEQKMVEAVTGLRQLNNGSTWTVTAYDDALSPVALTAVFMADRYHTVREVKRQIGPMRRDAAANSAAVTQI